MTEKLLEVENETVMKVAELEKQLLQKDKDLIAIRVRLLNVLEMNCTALEMDNVRNQGVFMTKCIL